MPEIGRLRGRHRELAELDGLMGRARAGHSGALVVSGEAGVGKTVLLDQMASRAVAGVRVERIVASESEMELAYAGLHQLCGHMMGSAGRLPAPQREAIEAAFGLRQGSAPSPFLVGLALLGLLTEAAGGRALLCLVDDAQWLDEASARAVAFAARRLDAEGIALVLAMRTVGEAFAGLPQLVVEGLGHDDARELLRLAVPGGLDRRVRDQLIAEARGNPLALRELPRALSPAEIAGGFALTGSMPLESRIEQSLIAQLDPLPGSARLLLLLAAADPTGDPGLLWRASVALGLGPADFDAATHADALVIGTRVGFRHPLVRSAVYRSASPEDRRRVHAALADVTSAGQDPDRRAWHRASATLLPDEDVAADLERSAVRARTRGGAAAAAAFLERAAELTPEPVRRGQRLIAAAEAKHDAGAPAAALRLLDTARDLPLTALQEALIARLRARAGYALRRDGSGAQLLLAAAQGLEGLDPVLARDTYIEALAAAIYGGRLGDPEQVATVANAILAATDAAEESDRARDLILRGQALLAAKGQQAAIATLRRAQRAFLDQVPDALELHWMWFASRAAQDLWDVRALRALADRQVELARAEGVVTVLPIALSLLMLAQTVDGDLDAAEASCDEIDAIKDVTGHPLPQYGRLFLAAYRGQAAEAERWAEQIRADAYARGEGYGLSAVNFAEAILYNGLGRFAEAMAASRRELPYTHELSHAMRTLLELVEAAVRTGERELAEEAFERLASVTRPAGTGYASGVLAMAEAQLREAGEAEALYKEAIGHFELERIPIMVGRCSLLYGEELTRRHRHAEARERLRTAYELLSGCGLTAFAERAARGLSASGETLRVPAHGSAAHLTGQELNVARLAREGLTNRDIGARLFISARTAEYHLRKVFMKLGIRGRAELRSALAELDPPPPLRPARPTGPGPAPGPRPSL
ncbi:transcriptional regulator [Sphaerisporangium melleum]|uniref:Transcriptional regulator n=1 Tax=Sphaerisporangium melleum TaxID=321316 RepID=A0A917RDP3_9ACTN|nr:LuxR family transcriptional regulator [Sphaerisporangium melleum]GGL02959.1 transcriptional regulator [Sphaerisporangium melleum]GII69456.1 transcriptional regulator [Sphaerisporangium melleum]